MRDAEESSIAELFGELRQSLASLHGRDLSVRSGALPSAVEQWLEGCLGHEPHMDIVDWFAFERFDSELVPDVRLDDLEMSKEISEISATGVDDPDGLLALDPAGLLEFFPIAFGGSGEVFVCSPTRRGADRPRVAILDAGEVSFEYVGDDPYISTWARHRSDLPTMRQWLRAAVDAVEDGRFSPSFQGFPGLLVPDVDLGFDSRNYDAGSVVHAYPWPRQVMPPEL